MANSLRQLFEHHQGKVSDKWQLYLEEWERLFVPYKNQPISLLEIGVQNGGSLEIWGKYFSNAKLFIGCDIDSKCELLHYDDPRINIIVGDARAEDCKDRILQYTPSFDIIIDDGSHFSTDIVRFFGQYFPLLKDNGIYIIEDLHCSYWDNFAGGLNNPLSAMAFFKRIADIINFEHWRNNKPRAELIGKFASEFDITFKDIDLARIHSIEFLNSLCIIKKLPPDKNTLGKRIISGIDDIVAEDWKKLNGTSILDIYADIKDDTNLDLFELIARNNSLDNIVRDREQSIQNLTTLLAEKENQVKNVQEQLAYHEEEEKNLRGTITEKENLVTYLHQQQADHERQEKILKEDIAEKEQSIHLLSTKAAEFNQEKFKLEANISEKNQTIKTLFSRLAKKQDELANLENQKLEITRQLEAKSIRENSFSSQLWEIKHSRAWLLVQFIWKLRLRLFPSGSVQTRMIRGVVKNLRVIKNEGIISFLKRGSHSISQYIPRNKGPRKTPENEIQSPELKIALVHPNPIYTPDTALEMETAISGVYVSPVIADDPAGLLERVMANLKNHVFLVSISHDDYLSVNFGVQMFISDEQKLFDKKHISYVHLYPVNGDDYLKNNSSLIIGLNVDSIHIGQYDEIEIKKLLKNILAKKYICVSINLHQFKGWTYIALKNVISAAHPEHLFFYVHDYYAICPQYTLLRNKQEFCNAPHMESNACSICVFKEKREIHLPLVLKLFHTFPFIAIAPSKSSLNLWKRALPQLHNEIKFEPHLLLKKTSVPLPISDYKVIRIAYAGQASPYKGWNTWRELVDQFASNEDYKMYHLGSPAGENPEYFEHIRVTPQNRTAMLDALRKHQIDILFHWSVLPETFSFVLYEAIGAGCFILTTNNNGNVADYVSEHKNGIVFDSYAQLTDYLSTTDTVRNDIRDFRKRYPYFYDLKNNQAILKLIKNQ